MGKPLLLIAPTTVGLKEMCGGAGEYDACTRFVAWKLEASCSRVDDKWSITAVAGYTPFILLRNVEKLPHEQEHLREVRGLVADYVAGLGRQAFATEAQCKAHGLIEGARFEATLRSFAEASNFRMHPQLARAKGRKPVMNSLEARGSGYHQVLPWGR